MNIVAIISLVLAVGVLVYFIVRVKKLLKAHEIGQEKYKLQKKEIIELSVLSGGIGLFLALAALFMALHKQYSMKVFEYIFVIIGPILAGGGLAVGLASFMFYYYKLDLEDSQKKLFRFGFPIGILVLFLGLFLFSEGIANHIIYPLVSGLSTGDGLIRGGNLGTGLQIKFYGILIVSGALLCFVISDHMLYKKFKKHGLIDTLFIVAFLFGILGARLWYCLVLEPTYFLAHPAEILIGIVSGGLAIQGGAILGIAAGVSYVCIFRKYIGLRRMMDIAVPTILLAQAIGRWGNFFNQEVYGAATNVQNLWFLPTIIKNNMFIDGAYRVPLFFIESCMNIAGYFFIRYVLGKVCKLKEGLGLQASAYLVWYGMTRVILELLRDSEFEYMQSWYVAFGMMGAGLIMAGIMLLIHFKRMKSGLEDKFGEKI